MIPAFFMPYCRAGGNSAFSIRLIETFCKLQDCLRESLQVNRQLALVRFLVFFAPLMSWGQSSFLYHEINEIRTNEVIKGITRDSTGFIWLASDQGVLKYDGTETVLFYQELQSPYTKKFLNTHTGNLLVISDLGVREIVERNDSISFVPFWINEHVFDQQLNYPKSIYEDRNGNIWIGEFNSIVKISSSGFKRYELGVDYQSISYHRTFSFGEDAFGNLWVAPFKGNVLVYNAAVDTFKPIDLTVPLTEVSDLQVVKGDYLLISGKEGIFKLKIDSDQRILATEFFPQLTNISALAGHLDDVFVGTWDQGLYHFNFQTARFRKVAEVAFNDIVDIYHDQSKQEYWIAGSENVGLLSASVVSSLGDVGRYRVESLSVENQDLYFSTGQEILKFDFRKPYTSPSLVVESHNSYFDCVEISGNDLWIGDSFGAIFRFDLDENALTRLKDSATGKAIKFILQDSRGNMWFTGDEHYLIRINDVDSLTLYPEIGPSNVIKEAPDGTLYCSGFGRDNLLFRYDSANDAFDRLAVKVDFPLQDISVEDIAFTEQGGIWMATSEGMLLVSQEDFAAESVQIPGLDRDEPYKAVQYYNGILWAAGTHGLSAYDGRDAVLFTNKNGLPSKILKERGIRIYENQLLIATAKGLARINPEIEIFRATPPPIYKQILVNGESPVANEEGKVMLPYNARIQAEFLTLTYPGGNVLYESRVVGVDNAWSEPSSNRFVSFLGFTEGEYQLEVRAKDLGHLWSEPAVFSFRVSLPWFKTWWAYLLFILAGLLIISVAIRVYNYSLILQKRKLKRIIELRTAEINRQKNEIIEQKNRIIQQKEELIEKNNAVHRSQQALSEADVNFLHLKEKQLRDQIEYRNKQITTHTLNIIQKNETLKDLRDKLEAIIKSPDKSTQTELRKTLKIIDESFRLDKDWEEFRLFFEQIYTGFYTKLKINCPALTTQELRHCALIRLNLSIPECASILGISPDSVKVSRARIRKKLDLEPGQGLTDFILSV